MQDDAVCGRKQLVKRAVVCITDNDRRTSARDPPRRNREALLVRPGKVRFVVTDEAVLFMGDSVRRIAVDHVAGPCLVHDTLEITLHDIHSLKCGRGSFDKAPCPENLWRSFAPKRNIKLT